jgi:hypothetical protein
MAGMIRRYALPLPSFASSCPALPIGLECRMAGVVGEGFTEGKHGCTPDLKGCVCSKTQHIYIHMYTNPCTCCTASLALHVIITQSKVGVLIHGESFQVEVQELVGSRRASSRQAGGTVRLEPLGVPAWQHPQSLGSKTPDIHPHSLSIACVLLALFNQP